MAEDRRTVRYAVRTWSHRRVLPLGLRLAMLEKLEEGMAARGAVAEQVYWQPEMVDCEPGAPLRFRHAVMAIGTSWTDGAPA